MRALFDTNILIDYLNGAAKAREEMARYRDKAISIISWMEVLVGATDDLRAPTRAFLQGFTVIPLDDAVAARAVELRRAHRIKLPDAVVWASADVNSMLLVTRNTKDFGTDAPGIRMPYTL